MILSLPYELWQMIRSFLNNRTIVETLLVRRPRSKSESLWTSLSVRVHDDLCVSIQRFLTHRQTISRTILYHMNVDDEWPFESNHMILVGCKQRGQFSPKVKKNIQFKYAHQINLDKTSE